MTQPDTSKTILIIDDEAGAGEFIRAFLEDRDYVVLTALNGKSGIDAIKTKNPSLVFLDMRMPDMSGVDVLTEIRRDGIDIKVILMTGVEEGAEIDAAKALGVIEVISKPVQLPVLSEILKKYT